MTPTAVCLKSTMKSETIIGLLTIEVKKSQWNKSITSSQLALKNRNIEEFREQIFLHCGMNLNIFNVPTQTPSSILVYAI